MRPTKKHVAIVMAYLAAGVGLLAIAFPRKSRTDGSSGGTSWFSREPEAPPPPAPVGRFVELWLRAESGDEDDLMRLANAEGAGGLEERLRADPARRIVAIRAVGFGSDFQLLGALADFIKGDKEDLSSEALKSAHRLLREHRAALGEDVEEFRYACDIFLAVAKEGAAERKRAANGLLRMMVPLGCSSDGELDALAK